MRRPEIAERASDAGLLSGIRAKAGKGACAYQMGHGGYDPARHVPWDASGHCDCSGFAAWAIGEERECVRMPGGWIETTAIVRDATSTHRVFEQVGQAEPGDLIVYGDRAGHQGHVGVILAVSAGRAALVIHCNATADGDAIDRTPADLFWRAGAIQVRYKPAA